MYTKIYFYIIKHQKQQLQHECIHTNIHTYVCMNATRKQNKQQQIDGNPFFIIYTFNVKAFCVRLIHNNKNCFSILFYFTSFFFLRFVFAIIQPTWNTFHTQFHICQSLNGCLFVCLFARWLVGILIIFICGSSSF